MELGNYKRMDFSDGLKLVAAGKYFQALVFFLGQLNEAKDNILDIDLLVAYENIGFCQMKLKKYVEAEPFFKMMAEINNNSRSAYYLGELAWSQEKYNEALTYYEEALTIKGQEHLNNIIIQRLMYCYFYTEQFDTAEIYANKILKINPKNIECINMLGNIASARLDFEKAIEFYKETLKIDKTYLMANQNIANAHFLMRNFSKAEYYNKKLLKHSELNSPSMFNLAQIYLAKENYDKGWEYFESRFVNTLPIKMKEELDRMLKHTKMWDGSSLKNKSLLVISEQGYGDSLQFSRFISLIPKDNTRIVLSAQPGLERILKSIDGIDEIITADVGSSPSPISSKTNEKFDYCVILMSLPYLLGINSKAKIPNEPYLQVAEEDKFLWRQKLGNGYKVGLVFAGERSIYFNKWLIDARRSMKISDFERHFKIPSIEWYNLTYHRNRPDLEDQIFYSPLIDLTNEINDFYDTACLMANFDLVVGVDTSPIHLAGGLGIETIMFNRFDSCWRWGSKGENTPWYENMTILRQPEFLNWEPCLEKLYKILLERI